MVSYEFLDKMFRRLAEARSNYERHKARSVGPFPNKQASKEHDAMTNALHGAVIAIEYSIKDYIKEHGVVA